MNQDPTTQKSGKLVTTLSILINLFCFYKLVQIFKFTYEAHLHPVDSFNSMGHQCKSHGGANNAVGGGDRELQEGGHK